MNKKKDEAFLRLSEKEVAVAIVLFFSICFTLFFVGYLWGSYSATKKNVDDFTSELRRSLAVYTGGSVDVSSDDPLVEDFDTDSDGERSVGYENPQPEGDG